MAGTALVTPLDEHQHAKCDNFGAPKRLEEASQQEAESVLGLNPLMRKRKPKQHCLLYDAQDGFVN